MAKFITLKMIVRETPAQFSEPTEGVGEDDAIEEQGAEPTLVRSGEVEWKPLTLEVDAIRTFYPRKGGKPGTRIVMKQGGVAYIVANDHDEIAHAVDAVNLAPSPAAVPD